VIIGLIVWGLARGFFTRGRVSRREETPATSRAGEDMVTCARCGVHMPRSSARIEGGSFYCGDNPRCASR
jgi:uncharacterized protein